MKTRSVLLAAGLAFSVAIGSSNAADIYAPSAGSLKDPVIADETIIPEADVFEEMADWYIRGQLGVGNIVGADGSGSVDDTSFDASGIAFDPVFSGGVGFGRYLTPHIRLGLDLEYRANTESGFTKSPNTGYLTNFGDLPVSVATTSIMLNAVYDILPNRRFSPYFGGGVGWAFHHTKLEGNAIFNDLDGNDADEEVAINGTGSKSNHFAANAVAGVSVKMRRDLFLDVGYQFSYLGDARMKYNYSHPGAGATAAQDGSGTLDIDRIMTHEFRLGLRYDLY